MLMQDARSCLCSCRVSKLVRAFASTYSSVGAHLAACPLTFHAYTTTCFHKQANKARLQERLRSRKNLLELQETSAKEHAAQHKALRAAQAAYSFVGKVAAAAAATASSSKTSLHATSDSAAAVTAVSIGNRWRAAAAADNAFDADEKVKLGLVPTAASASYHKQHRSSSSSSSSEVNVDATGDASNGAKDTAEEEYADDHFTVNDGNDGDQSSGTNNSKQAAQYTAPPTDTDNAEVAIDGSHD
jgi:hypothetical protein